MRKSQILYTDKYKAIEGAIVQLLNSEPDFLSSRTAASTRAAGDAIQAILSERFRSLLGEWCQSYRADFPRRAMADFAFTDRDGFYYAVDVKTRRLETTFHMPNLTSAKRLAEFYENDDNYFVLLMVEYATEGPRVEARRAHFVPIEFLAWDCLTVGALGWGQIQIAQGATISIRRGYCRRKWMLELCGIMLTFYPKEIAKTEARISYFDQLKEKWENKRER